jgi:beta-phosphoglucomutase
MNMISNLNHKFAVIFDMDGVIVDSNPTHTIALRKFCEQHGYFLTDDELKVRIYGRANKDWLPDLFGNKMTPGQYKKLADEKEALFRELFEPVIKPLNGLIHFLDSLVQNNITRAVASSAPPENVAFTLGKTGTKKYFDIVLDETSFSKGKPDPEIYLKTTALIGLPPGKCVVFEDSLSGVEAARKAGCKVIGVSTTHSKDEFIGANLIIDDFEGLTLADLEKLYK